MIVVYPFVAKERDEPELEKGQKYVNYGLNIKTLETIPLPTEKWDIFIKENCIFNTQLNEYILKELK